MRIVTVSRMHERYAQTVFTFQITYIRIVEPESLTRRTVDRHDKGVTFKCEDTLKGLNIPFVVITFLLFPKCEK